MWTLSIAIVLLVLGCTVPEETALPESRAAVIRDSVTAFLSSWSERTGEGEWDRLAQRYADDPRFQWVEDGMVRYTSANDVRAGFEALAETFSATRTEFTDPTITPLAPGIANVTTRFRTTLYRPDGGEVGFGGAISMTVVDTRDGWKVLQGHMSSERERQRR